MKKERGVLVLLVAFFSLFMISSCSAQTTIIGVNFTTGAFTCLATPTSALWVDSATGETQAVPTEAACNAYGTKCCPTGILSACNATSGQCYDGSRITECRQYHDKDNCEEDSMYVANVSVGNTSDCDVLNYFLDAQGNTCTNITACECIWRASTHECSARKVYNETCPNKNTGWGICAYSPFNLTNGDCSNSNLPITVTATASWSGHSLATKPSTCIDINRNYPCVSTAKLPFFTSFSFILSAISIIFIYCLLNIRKRK